MAVQKIIGKVEFKDNLADNVWLVRLRFDKEVEFSPGQYVSVKVNDKGERRSYSVASLPSDGEKRNFVDILIDVSPGGVGSKFFMGLSINDEVEILGFLGRFTIDEEVVKSGKELLFVATGTGIAPIKPMIEDLLLNKKYQSKVRLIWGMRFEKDLYWVEYLEGLTRDHKNFEFDLVLSQSSAGWPGKKGHVGDIVNGLKLDWSNTAVFLCGAPEMIEDIRELSLIKGINEANIYYEKYY